MSEGISQKCFQMYQMSLKNLESDSPDLADEVIVFLWRTLEAMALEKQVLQEVIVQQQQEIVNYCHKIEMHSAKSLKEAYGDVNVLDVLKPFMKGEANEN